MMDDMERYEPTPGTELAGLINRARARNIKADAVRPKADESGNRRSTITLFGSPRRVLGIGEAVELRASDGSWRTGYRATSGVTTDEEYPEQDVVWVSTEEEWSAAESEGRTAMGSPWPLAQMRPAREAG